MLALGKDGNAYLLNRNNLGGITAPVAQLSVGFTNQANHLPLIPPPKEPISFFVQEVVASELTRLLRQLRLP